jgi:hypothetical protein
MSEYTGGAAFPLEGSAKRGAQSGMTLRDYFAAKAMAGMFANDDLLTRYGVMAKEHLVDPEFLVSAAAYSCADAMLKERAK